jgi:hypothetical protein
MRHLPLVCVCLLVMLSPISDAGSTGAATQTQCAYEVACNELYSNGAYFMRSDGVLVRLNLGDHSVYEFPNRAPAGPYVALTRLPNSPMEAPFFLTLQSGATYVLNAAGPEHQWQHFATLPSCAPVPTVPATIGNVKGKYR